MIRFTLLALAALTIHSSTFAQGWPARPVRLIANALPGGTVDQLARTVSSEFSRTFGRPFVVDHKAGANGDIAAEQLIVAPADGHTFMVSSHGSFVINMHLRKQSFDPRTAFAPITPLAVTTLVLVVHPAVPARNLSELLGWLRSNSGKASYASPGIGSSGHMAMALLIRQARVSASHVPYKTSAAVTVDLLGGNVQMMFDTSITALQHVRAGKLRAIAVADLRRMSAAPDIPTIAESGFPGFETAPWYALTARAGTPRDVVELLASEWSRVIAKPDIQERFAKIGVGLRAQAPEVFRDYIQQEYEKWGAIIRASKTKND